MENDKTFYLYDEDRPYKTNNNVIYDTYLIGLIKNDAFLMYNNTSADDEGQFLLRIVCVRVKERRQNNQITTKFRLTVWYW